MPIEFRCSCGKTLRVPDAHAGKRAKCPACAAVATVPEPDPVLEVVEAAELAPPPPPLPLPPLPQEPAPATYGKSRFEDDAEEDKTPYGLAEPEPRSTDLDRNGQPRHRGTGLPNFNKGRKNYGN